MIMMHPLAFILQVEFVATHRALCSVLTESHVEHEEMHQEAEQDWLETMLALRWAVALGIEEAPRWS